MRIWVICCETKEDLWFIFEIQKAFTHYYSSSTVQNIRAVGRSEIFAVRTVIFLWETEGKDCGPVQDQHWQFFQNYSLLDFIVLYHLRGKGTPFSLKLLHTKLWMIEKRLLGVQQKREWLVIFRNAFIHFFPKGWMKLLIPLACLCVWELVPESD